MHFVLLHIGTMDCVYLTKVWTKLKVKDLGYCNQKLIEIKYKARRSPTGVRLGESQPKMNTGSTKPPEGGGADRQSPLSPKQAGNSKPTP